MNRLTINHFTFWIIVFLTLILCLPALGQTINVTMQLNTATNQDTVMEHHYVDVRGECTGDNLPAITWDNATGIVLQNIGGDYWETTFQMTAGDTMRFKFWTGFDASTSTYFDWGYEGPFNPADPLGGDTRSFIAGNQDTTLALQFYHGTETTQDQFWQPYEAKPDSFAVYFRVNMGGVTETGVFDPDTDAPVGVRGGAPLDPADDWSADISLIREDGSIDNGSFYSGVAYIANNSVSGGEQQSFKFVYKGTAVWESTANRVFSYSGAKDTTIRWTYFNDQPPTGTVGETINVTMQLNTATNQDTVMEHHTVHIRGEATGVVVPAITWGDDTGLIMQNIGGDYWETTFQMNAGDIMRFKFWTGFDASTSTYFDWGYEGPFNPADPLGGDTRSFIAGNQDTTLALQFYHGTETTQDQFWQPYEAKPDSFVVYFRVNMGGVTETGDFDPDTDGPVGVRGGAPLDPADDWSADISLTREDGSIDNGSFYSGVAYIANNSVSGGEQQSFKFVYRGTDVWESTANRVFSYSGAKDTTIHWAYFNDQPPTGAVLVAANLTWQVKTDGLEKLGLFDRGLGERIVIDGAKAWNIEDPIVMEYVPLLQLWLAEEPFIKAPGSTFEYKAVILWDPSRVDNTSENYIPGLDLEVPLQYWDEPIVTGSGNRIYVYTDQTEQMIAGDYGFEYQYFNGLPAEGVIETPISITFSIDMTPASDVATNPANPLFRPGIDSCEIQLYGCLMSLTQGYGLYDSSKTIELEDPDGNLVYTGTCDLTPPTTFAAGYRINYSSESGTIQNGGGFGKGRSYYQFIHPTSVNVDGTIEWPTEFSFPELLWMDNDLAVEDPPDLWTPTGINPDEGFTIQTFKLAQNYPNPFNPVTSIQYDVAHTAAVRIEIYNLIGQLVTTLVDEKQNQGHYRVQWNGKDQSGTPVPSGIYFTRMTADTFKQIRKLTLIR